MVVSRPRCVTSCRRLIALVSIWPVTRTSGCIIEIIDRLCFDDGAFDYVLHVLEHLNNLYTMFYELIRISRRHVLVELPNCWLWARCPLERG